MTVVVRKSDNREYPDGEQDGSRGGTSTGIHLHSRLYSDDGAGLTAGANWRGAHAGRDHVPVFTPN